MLQFIPISINVALVAAFFLLDYPRKDGIWALKLFVQIPPDQKQCHHSFIKMKKSIIKIKKLDDLDARRKHDAGDDHGDEEQEPVHHTRGRGVLQHHNTPLIPVLRIRIPDPVPFDHLDPGWVKNQDPDIRAEQPGSYFRQLRNNILG